MSQFDELFTTARSVGMNERSQFLQYILNVVQKSGKKLPKEDISAILDFAYEQVDVCTAAIPEASNYREKDQIFTVGDHTLGIIMALCPTPASIPEDKLMRIESLVKIVENERKIETTLESIFQQNAIEEVDMNRLLYWVRQTNDEYQRGTLYSGLLHYRDRLGILSEGAKAKLTQHMQEEMERILAHNNVGGDLSGALELLADVCRYFPADKTPELLRNTLNLHQHPISYYAVESLLALKEEVPADVINALAKDLVYADLIHSTLAQYGKESLFPAHLNDKVYLAKSDLVHWLTYPTELGQAPDEIEYIGEPKYLFRKDVYHVFKFRSDSETLDEALRGKWLIGWSNRDGGTFSNFDEFEKFDLGDPDKTLKNIKKKLLK